MLLTESLLGTSFLKGPLVEEPKVVAQMAEVPQAAEHSPAWLREAEE